MSTDLGRTEEGTVDPELEAERAHLLGEIARIDEEHRSGALSDDEHRALRADLVHRAADVIRRIARASAPGSEDGPTVVEADPPMAAEPVVAGDSPSRSGGRRSGKRAVWVVLVVVVAMAAGAALYAAIGDRTGTDSATGSVPQDSNSLLLKAAQQTSKGDAAGAVKTYDRIIRQDPRNVQAMTYRGWLVRVVGQADDSKKAMLSAEGMKSIEQAIAIDPTYGDAHLFRGLILLQDRQDPAGAVPELQRYLDGTPQQQMVPLVRQAVQDAQAQVAAQAH